MASAGFSAAARRHLLLLGAVNTLLLAAGAWLNRLALLNANHADSVFAGPGFAEYVGSLPGEHVTLVLEVADHESWDFSG